MKKIFFVLFFGIIYSKRFDYYKQLFPRNSRADMDIQTGSFASSVTFRLTWFESHQDEKIVFSEEIHSIMDRWQNSCSREILTVKREHSANGMNTTKHSELNIVFEYLINRSLYRFTLHFS